MKTIEMTNKEQLVLYGLSKYPKSTDKELSKKLGLKHSTVTSIRHRLYKNGYFRPLTIPRLQNMGCKMLVILYTNFSPLIPLEERVKITGKTIEVFEEIFFSVGEQDKGFSLSLSQDFATIGRINDIRTQTFGGRNLLEEKYPTMIVFPFEISKVHRFFDFAPLLKKRFNLELKSGDYIENIATINKEDIDLSDTEKNVYCMLIRYPEYSDSSIGSIIGVSRHTVSRLRKKFEHKYLVRKINLPDLKKLGFEILTLYHIRFDPRKPPDIDKNEAAPLLGNSTIFLTRRVFEAVMISVYSDYDDFKKDSTRIMQILKENNWIAEKPIIRSHSLNELIIIKDFKFAPIAKKILACDIEV